MFRLNSSQAFAKFLAEKREPKVAILATRRPAHSVKLGVDIVDNTAANQTAEHAIEQFRRVGGHSDAVFNLQMGLGTILSLTRSRNEWDLPDSKRSQKLLGAVYKALGDAVVWLSDEIEIDQLTEGMLAAARLVQDIDNEAFSGDRHKDDKTRVKVLIHYSRIAEHRNDIEERRRDREHASVEQMRRSSQTDSIFG